MSEDSSNSNTVFACHCGKSYNRQENLTRHRATHAATKRFVCPESSCGRTFTRSDLRTKHIKAIHPERPTLSTTIDEEQAARSVSPSNITTHSESMNDRQGHGTNGSDLSQHQLRNNKRVRLSDERSQQTPPQEDRPQRDPVGSANQLLREGNDLLPFEQGVLSAMYQAQHSLDNTSPASANTSTECAELSAPPGLGRGPLDLLPAPSPAAASAVSNTAVHLMMSPQITSTGLQPLLGRSLLSNSLAQPASGPSPDQMANLGFNFDQDVLVWNALGMNSGASDLISGGNDIPWILDYTWLSQDAVGSSQHNNSHQPSLANESSTLPPASTSSHTDPMRQQKQQQQQQQQQQATASASSRNVNEGLDSSLLFSMLQDIQTRGEGDYESWKSRFTTTATPLQTFSRSRAMSPNGNRPSTSNVVLQGNSCGNDAAMNHANSTINDAERQEEDKWPMNWHPAGQTYALSSNTTAIVTMDLPDIDEPLKRWQRFWIDQETYEKVKNSFALAKAMPGPDVQKLKMPKSLTVVNTLISLYFDKFYPQHPLLHLPTFEPSKSPPLLLASFICIGACYSDLPGSRPLALDLIEVIRKTLNALFEHDGRNLRMISLIHVYFLVVTAGLFIGNKRTYELAEASRGTLINLCRRAELLDSLGSSREIDTSADLATRWRQWISFESKKRLGTAICLLDTVFPALLDIPAYHSHRDMFNLAMPCDEQFWNAPSAHTWSNLLGLATMPPSPFFTNCIVPLLLPHFSPEKARDEYKPMHYLNDTSSLLLCSALSHHTYEFRTHLSFYLAGGHPVPLLTASNYHRENGSGFAGRREWLREALNTWAELYLQKSRRDGGDLLFHLGHISLYVYVGGLYDAIGKRGERAANEARADLRVWATQEDAIHSVDHALSIIEALPGMELSFYYPLCGFVAVLVIWAYCKYATGEETENDMRRDARLLRFLGFARRAQQFSNCSSSSSSTSMAALGRGAELLAKGRAWRIGAALALLLAKQMEEGG